MYYLVKDIDSWEEKISLKRAKVVAFVSNGFVGEERRQFDNIFDQFAAAYYKKAIFLYVNVDEDELRSVFEDVSGGLDIFPVVAVYDIDGKLIKKEINPPPKRFRDLVKMAVMASGGRRPFITVTDKTHWDELKDKPLPKAAAFVANYFKGREREEFDRMFREFARAHKDEILFLYVICDYDNLWDVYEELKPGGLRLIPLVATMDQNGSVVETYINPSPRKFRDMLKRVIQLGEPEDLAEDVNSNKEDNDD